MKGVSWNSLLKEKDMSYRLREVPWGLFQQTFGQWNEGEWEEQVKVGSLYMHMYVYIYIYIDVYILQQNSFSSLKDWCLNVWCLSRLYNCRF